MKPITTPRNKFSGKLYKFLRKNVGSDTVLEYYFAKKIFVTAKLDTNNKMTILCDEPLAIGFIIKDIVDVNNNLIMSDTAWQVSSIQPALNAFGAIDSYTMKAVKYQGII